MNKIHSENCTMNATLTLVYNGDTVTLARGSRYKFHNHAYTRTLKESPPEARKALMHPPLDNVRIRFTKYSWFSWTSKYWIMRSKSKEASSDAILFNVGKATSPVIDGDISRIFQILTRRSTKQLDGHRWLFGSINSLLFHPFVSIELWVWVGAKARVRVKVRVGERNAVGFSQGDLKNGTLWASTKR